MYTVQSTKCIHPIGPDVFSAYPKASTVILSEAEGSPQTWHFVCYFTHKSS